MWLTGKQASDERGSTANKMQTWTTNYVIFVTRKHTKIHSECKISSFCLAMGLLFILCLVFVRGKGGEGGGRWGRAREPVVTGLNLLCQQFPSHREGSLGLVCECVGTSKCVLNSGCPLSEVYTVYIEGTHVHKCLGSACSPTTQTPHTQVTHLLT